MGRIEVFEIPYPAKKTSFTGRFTLNAYYSGKHWAQRKKDAEELHTMTFAALKRAHIKKGAFFQGPVKVTFYWNDGLDADNHAVVGKAVLDACKGYLIEDDNRKHVQSVTHAFWQGDAIRVVFEEAGG